MSLSEQDRPPFVLRRNFILTPFEKRFQGILQNARQDRSWHIIAAVPGSGKSLGIHDFVRRSGACKGAGGRTFLPVLAIRAPEDGATEQALGHVLSEAFGVVPKMPWYALRTWLVRIMASTRVECIIADDAQDFSRHHLAFLKKLTDNLAAPPYEFEDLYRSQLPDLQLRLWADSIFEWLTHPILDPDATGRVTMDHLTRLVTSSLRRAYSQGATNVDAATLTEVAEMMILKRDEVVTIDGVPADVELPVREVG